MDRVRTYIDAFRNHDFSVWPLAGINRESPGDYAALVADLAQAVAESTP